MKTIFISHNSKDKVFVRRLASSLQKFEIKCWIDEGEIKIGDSLTDKIGEAIQVADFFLVVLSRNSVKSVWVKKELQIALNLEFFGKKVFIIPVVVGKAEIPLFLRDKLYADFSKSSLFEQKILEVARAVGVIESGGAISESFYLLHEIKMIVEIKDTVGHKALWTKVSDVTPIRKGIKTWLDTELYSDGEVKVISAIPGRIINTRKVNSNYSILSEFDIELEVFSRFKRILKMEVIDGFTEVENTITWMLTSNFEKVCFKIVLPIERPFKGMVELWTLYMSERKTVEWITPVTNIIEVCFDKTKIGYTYGITWRW